MNRQSGIIVIIVAYSSISFAQVRLVVNEQEIPSSGIVRKATGLSNEGVVKPVANSIRAAITETIVSQEKKKLILSLGEGAGGEERMAFLTRETQLRQLREFATKEKLSLSVRISLYISDAIASDKSVLLPLVKVPYRCGDDFVLAAGKIVPSVAFRKIDEVRICDLSKEIADVIKGPKIGDARILSTAGRLRLIYIHEVCSYSEKDFDMLLTDYLDSIQARSVMHLFSDSISGSTVEGKARGAKRAANKVIALEDQELLEFIGWDGPEEPPK